MEAARVHGEISQNPYHLSFKLCANNASQNGEGRTAGCQDLLYSKYLPSTTHEEHHCDLCDRSFRNDQQLQRHIKEHVTCKIDGCQFTAHPKIIANHVRMQHTSGIFNKIKKLNNPEEIKKWVAERKRKYPTRANVEYREKLNAAKRARNEIVEHDNKRFNPQFQPNYKRSERMKKKARRKSKKKGPPVNGSAIQPVIKKEPVDNFLSTTTNGDLPNFAGTTVKIEVEDEPEEKFHISDDEETVPQCDGIKTEAATVAPVNKSLVLLMSAYDSQDDSDEENATTQPVTAPDNDDGPPKEVQTVTTRGPQGIVDSPERKAPIRNSRKHLARSNDRMRKVTKYPMRPRKPTLLQQLYKDEIEREKIFLRSCISYVVKKKFFIRDEENGKTKPLLRKLLSSEIVRERNLILQCVRHVCNRNFYST